MSGSDHIRRRGAHSWELKFDAGNDPVTGQRLTKYRSFKGTKAEAKAELVKLMHALTKGAYVERSQITVGEHVRRRIEQWQALGKIGDKTAERYRELHANQIASHIGNVPLQSLKAAAIEKWHATLKTSGRKDGTGGLSALTIRHAHRLLSKALKEAARHDLVVRNVAGDEAPPRVERDEVTILTGAQVRNTVERLRTHPIFAKVIISLFAGLRRSEALALRWRHIDLDARTVSVREAVEETNAGARRLKEPKTKAGKRDVTLPDIAVEALRDHRRQQLEMRIALGMGKLGDDALIFARLDGLPESPRTLSKGWAAAAKGMGLLGITFHALRHTHARMLVDAGIDVVKIAKRLGHANVSTTLDVYSHLFAAREDKSATAINEAVAALFSA
jgi:integrase